MYVPTRFCETDVSRLQAFIEENSFATLVTHTDGKSVASHLPLLLDRTSGELGGLVGHMARANDQWRGLDGQPCLVIFNGPHAYISPSWYEEHNVVPTWNYLAVHAHGRFYLDDDPVRRLEIVRDSVQFYESAMSSPWSVDNADSDFIEKIAEMITGFRIEILSLEGNWKLNQHHSTERRERVADALRAAGGEDQVRIADFMTE